MCVRINEVVGVGRYSGSYIITSVNPEAPVHRGFWHSIQRYAQDRNAEVVLLPVKPHLRPLEKDDDEFPLCYADYDLDGHGLTFKNRRLNKKVQISNETILSQQIIPTTGLARFTQSDVTTIFASPKQELEVVPNSNVKLPKILTTTGSLTKAAYRNNRIGNIARRDHTLGAVVVDIVDDRLYHLRHVEAMNSGEFVDLNVNYGPQQKKGAVLEALVLGDWHHGDTDPEVRDATYDMIAELHPRRLVLHDYFNGHSINHHEWEKSVTRAKDFRAKRTSLEEELRSGAAELRNLVEAMPKGADIVIPDCNHHDFMIKFLESGQFTKDRENALIAAKLFAAMIEGQNPVQAGLKMFYDMPANVRFLKRDEDYKVRHWQLGAHGDKGGNGAKGSVTSREKAYGQSITGHTHTPQKRRRTFIVGTSTYLQLRYNEGPSSWMNTHALLYDTGKVQLVNIIGGEWRLDED